MREIEIQTKIYEYIVVASPCTYIRIQVRHFNNNTIVVVVVAFSFFIINCILFDCTSLSVNVCFFLENI